MMMRFPRTMLALALAAASSACAQPPKAETDKKPAAAAATLETDDQKTLYALGLAVARNLGAFNLTESELELVKAGLTDAVLKREPKVDFDAYAPKLQQLAQTRQGQMAEAEKTAGSKLLEEAAAKPGAVKTESGMVFQSLQEGTGASPAATDTVKVHYRGTLRDGTEFDSSYSRNEPATFPLNRVIPCWTEGLQKMKVGGKAKLVCPAGLAYGDRGSPPKILPGSTLTFEVELLDIVSSGGAPTE